MHVCSSGPLQVPCSCHAGLYSWEEMPRLPRKVLRNCESFLRICSNGEGTALGTEILRTCGESTVAGTPRGPDAAVFPPQVVHTHRPHFLALHCQEFGGKNYEASMSHVDKFVRYVPGQPLVPLLPPVVGGTLV